MPVAESDLALLAEGKPPAEPRLLDAMTVGRELWLDRFREQCLENFLSRGGSKVKILVGEEGSGKTHLLRCVEADARSLNYETAFIGLRRETEWRLMDIIGLYRAVAGRINREILLRGLCRRVASLLDFGPDRYDGSGSLLPLLIEEVGESPYDAGLKLQKAIIAAFKRSDVSPSFRRFAQTLTASRMRGSGDDETDASCWKWFAGEKLASREKRLAHLYDRLARATGRVWLYSLASLIKLSGRSGLVLIIDELETVTERDPASGKFRYSASATKDVYELIRQLIDETEFLENTGILIAGRPAILDERRGIKSYEALWMRLQTGLTSIASFNPFADMVDVDKHFDALEAGGFTTIAGERLQAILRELGLPRDYHPGVVPRAVHPLRRAIIEIASTAQREGIDHGAV